MAQSSSQILEQISKQYGNPSDASNIIESTIRDAYAPSVKNLIQEGNTLRGEYYPAFFNEAQKLGTTAADMSPAARLAAMQQAGESAGQLYRTNLGLRDYYKTDINSMIDRAMQMYNAGYGSLKDMYSMALQGEQARAANEAANAQANYFKNLGKPPSAADVDLNTVPTSMANTQKNVAFITNLGAKIVPGGDPNSGYYYQLPNGKKVYMYGAIEKNLPVEQPAVNYGSVDLGDLIKMSLSPVGILGTLGNKYGTILKNQ